MENKMIEYLEKLTSFYSITDDQKSVKHLLDYVQSFFESYDLHLISIRTMVFIISMYRLVPQSVRTFFFEHMSMLFQVGAIWNLGKNRLRTI